MRIRTVVCTLTLTGTPEWVALTLEKAWTLPDRSQRTAFGTVSAVPVRDDTREVSDEEAQVILRG